MTSRNVHRVRSLVGLAVLCLLSASSVRCSAGGDSGPSSVMDTNQPRTDTAAPITDTPAPMDTEPTDSTAQDTIPIADADDSDVNLWTDTTTDTPINDVPAVPDVKSDDASPEDDIEPVDGIADAADASLVDVAPLVPVAEPLFRLHQLTWASPDLCYVPPDDANAPCVPLTSLVNTLIENMLNDVEEPTDVLFQFHGPIHEDGLVAMTLGEGLCKRDTLSVIQYCMLQEKPDVPYVTFTDVPIVTVGTCLDTPDIPGPCFATPKKNGVALNVTGISLGLKQAFAAGQFQGSNPKAAISGGHLQGFMPKVVAQTVQFNLPTGQPLTLAQLLSQVPTIEVDGHPGWALEFKLEASQQPTL